MSPNERLNNIILERTIKYNTTRPQLIPRQKNPTLPLRSRYMERKTKVHMAYNLGQYKMEQLSPIPPKAMMKARRSKKRAILASLKWGEGWSRCSIYFVQDCSHVLTFSSQVITCFSYGISLLAVTIVD